MAVDQRGLHDAPTRLLDGRGQQLHPEHPRLAEIANLRTFKEIKPLASTVLVKYEEEQQN